jgi:superfamily II DNA or RNA helicase
MKTPYPYQSTQISECESLWSMGVRYVLDVLPTGGGKTVVLSHILAKERLPSIVIAHRKELLSQAALMLAENEVPHSVLAPEKTGRYIGDLQRETHGASWVRPQAKVCVASVDTLLARRAALKQWALQVGLWITDEAHHVRENNKWGKVIKLFSRARGLGLTATPRRGDRKSLKAGRGGVFQVLVQGPSMRDLINAGYLTDYRIFSPPSDLDLGDVSVGSGGDYNKKQLTRASRRSSIIGDVVEHYLRIAPGLRGLTFVTDVETARDTAEHFKSRGVPACALWDKTPEKERFDAMRAMRNGELLQLVNVDLLGEGVDLPAVHVVSMARASQSFVVVSQQFGRMVRKFPGKKYGILIDHVGNIVGSPDRKGHGLPDAPRRWDLDADLGNASPSSEPPLRTCGECLRVWDSFSRECPYCGWSKPIAARSTPEMVEGDLVELDPETLSAMRGEVAKVDASVPEALEPLKRAGASTGAIAGLAARHRERQKAQAVLRESMSLWGAYAKRAGLSNSERHMRFYHEFGVDVLSAQALGRPDAEALTSRVDAALNLF